MTVQHAGSSRGGRPKARAHVVRLLCEVGAMSRADLARRAALAPSTVSAIVHELADEGLVVESQRAPADNGAVLGRPGTLVALHRRAGIAAGLDFGKRHLGVAVSDLAHTIVAERRRAVDDDLPAAEGIA